MRTRWCIYTRHVEELIPFVGGKAYTASELQGQLIESDIKDETRTVVSDDVIQVDLQLLLLLL